MPYPTLADLPDAVQKMPKHAQEIYQKAFNAAYKTYNGEEHKAHAVAWTAVERSYKKENGRWVAKEAVHPHGEHICVCSECGKEITVEADIKCNTQECPECGAPMVAKTAGDKRTKEAKMLSDKNRSKLLQAALVTEYKIGQSTPIPKNLTIDEVFGDKVVYDIDGQLYESSYELDGDGKATFGEPKKVLSTKVYKTMEALQVVYSDIIQEAGRRNASLDSKRLKQILSLCQELLSSEAEEDDEKVKDTTAKAEEALSWLKEQAAMKTEEGESYPAAAYAYMPDSEKSSTWKLRLWEDPEKKVTRAQLGRAAAALSPGGFRGQKVAIPTEDLAAVKRAIRAEYRKLNVDEDDIPRWVKEAMSRELVQNFTSLSEAKFDKGRATIIVIKPGFNADKSRYYPIEMLKRDYKVFEGMKMYADHPTEEEDKSLPERSVKSTGWVSSLKDVTVDEAGVVTGVADIIEDWMMRKLANLRDKKMLSEMGISINAVGRASKATIDGVTTLVVEELTDCRSVDFVTEPGAGGLVTFYEADRSRDIDLVELSALKERRPDLVKDIEANVRAEISKEVKKSMENEQRITELEGENETLTTENTDLKNKISEAEKAQAKAVAQAAIKEAVDAATLPNAAKERLIERFVDAESADGIAEAIQSEIDYVAKLSEAGKVKNLGVSIPATEQEEKALREAIKRANPDFTDAQLEVAVSGR